ncbi:MAG TPA: histidine kinase, partial [Pyrinomonadaceae bacterium]|nr:histidine kinase [Pyrinomonadaceae bacterium]
LVQAQLQALKMQLQPHFLFNTLNSISSLVLKNPTQAQTMIAKLGDFLRMTLDFNENQMVLLSEELRFLRSYLEIEQTRFSEKLQVIFNINEVVMNAVVPHLALQPIVENSVKHGISQMKEGGRIEIIAQKVGDKLQLQVKDNGNSNNFPQAAEKNKTGISNVKARLKHLFGEDFGFEMNSENGKGMIVTITIPLSFEFTIVEKNGE